MSNICVTIAEKTYAEIVEAIADFEFVEIRLDLTGVTESEIRRIFATPSKQLIATCRKGTYVDVERVSRLTTAIEAGAGYIDIELEESDFFSQTLLNVAKRHGCKVIISHHDFEKTPESDSLENIIVRSKRLDADIVKLITTAHSSADCARIVALYAKYTNLIAFAMGNEGRITRLACTYLGAPFTYASANDYKVVASGQLSIAALKELTNILKST